MYINIIDHTRSRKQKTNKTRARSEVAQVNKSLFGFQNSLAPRNTPAAGELALKLIGVAEYKRVSAYECNRDEFHYNIVLGAFQT